MPISFPQNDAVGQQFNEALSFTESSINRGFGIGVKSFSWNYVGTNPASAKKDVKANLSMTSHNFDEFLKIRTDPTTGIEYRIIDLVLHPSAHKNQDEQLSGGQISNSPLPNNVYDARDYKIKIKAGWKVPTNAKGLFNDLVDEGGNKLDVEGLEECLSEHLYLTLIDHDINIADNGTVTLSIEYAAYIEEVIQGEEYNVLYPTMSTWNGFYDLQKQYYTAINQCEQLSDEELSGEGSESVSEKIDEANEVYAEKIEKLKYEGYQSMIRTLSDRERIFSISLSKESVVLAKINRDWKAAVLSSTGGEDDEEDSLLSTANVEDATDTTLDELKELSEQGTNLFSDNSRIPLNYFFLGDLLDVVYDYAYTRSDSPAKLKIILPTVPYRTKEGAIKYINIAHIPVAVDYFNEWFAANVISTDVSAYSLIDFVRLVTQTFVGDLLGAECFAGRNDLGVRLQIGFLKGANIDGVERFASKGVPSYYFIDTSLERGYLNLSQESADSNNITHYLMAYPSNALYLSEQGDTRADIVSRDQANGIVYFSIGSPTGFIKSINFAKKNIPGLREARFERLGLRVPLSQLSNVYDANVTLYGLPNFYPGDRVYIEPFGLGVGHTWKAPDGAYVGSPAWALGIGGYHIITEINSEISRGQYVTNMTCRWESSDGNVRLFDLQSQTVPQAGTVTRQDCVKLLSEFIESSGDDASGAS